MATMQEYIERLIYQFTSTGADQVAADMNKVGAAQTTTSTAALSLEKSFNSLERRMDSSVRAAQDYASIQAKVAAAVAQNPALQERANNVLALAEQRYAAAARGGSLYGQSLNAAQAQMQAFAAQAGMLGTVLEAIGPAGLAAAAGIGVLTLAYKAASDASHDLGQKAIDLKKFSETTGLSTQQVQALRIEARKVGVSSEDTETALQKFTVSFEELRQGSGQALEVLRRYRPDLAAQMQATESTATAINLLAKAYDGLTVSQRNALSRSFFGRGGVNMTEVMQGLDLPAITQNYSASGRGLTEGQIETLSKLERENQALRKQFSEGAGKIFAEDVLRNENAFLQTLIKINHELKDIKVPTDLLKMLATPGIGPMAPLIFGTEQLFGRGAQSGRQNEVVGADLAGLPSTTASMAEAGKAQQTALIAAQIKDIERLKGVLGDLMSVEDQVYMKELQLQEAQEKGINLTREEIDAISARTRVQAEMAQVAPGTYERQVEAIEQLKAAYPGLTAAEAQRMQNLDQQLQMVQAVTAAEKLSVQEAITFQQEINKGATEEQAAAVATKQRAIAQAQINAGAQQSLAALQSQSAVANARTTDERLAAQEIATQVSLMRQGVSEELAMAIAAQERANAEDQINVAFEKQLALAEAVTGAQKIAVMDWREAAVAIAEANSNIERQITSLEQGNQMILARINGTEAATAAQIAYNNAVAAGADEEQAAALKRATYHNQQLQQLEKQSRQIDDQGAEFDKEMAARNANAEALQASLDKMTSGGNAAVQSASSNIGQMIKQLNDLGDHVDDYFRGIAVGQGDVLEVLTMTTDLQERLQRHDQQKIADEAKQKQQQEAERAQQEAEQAQQEAQQKQESIQSQIENLQRQGALAEARKISPEAEAQLQAQNAYTDAIKEGATAAQAQQIADLTLANALADNTSAVQSNTDALSSYYATDPRLSHLGFRAGSSALGYDPFAQPAAGAGGPAALPLGSTVETGGLPTVSSPSIAPSATSGGGDSHTWYGPNGQRWDDRSASITTPWYPGTPESMGWSKGLAAGGVIPPGGLAYVGEHGPNPGFMRAGAEQIVVTPGGMQGLTGPSPGQPRSGTPYNVVSPGGMQIDARDLLQGITGGASGGVPRNGTPYNVVSPGGMQIDARDLLQGQRSGTGNGRSIQIVQNFNAPVDRGVAAEMKTTAYQAAQAGMRSLRAVR